MPTALEEMIKTRIIRGEYSPGAALKSERHYANELGWSCNKVHRTLQKLVKDGYLRSRRGSGYFVNMNSNAKPERGMIKVAYLQAFSAAIANMLNIKAGRQDIWLNIIPNNGEDLNPVIEQIIRGNKHDAILIDRPDSYNYGWGMGFAMALDMHFPLILRGNHGASNFFPSLEFNSFEFGFMAAKIFQSRGYRRVLFFGYEAERAPGMKLRLDGFIKGCSLFDLEYEIMTFSAAEISAGVETDLIAALKKRRFDSVFAGSGSFTHIAAKVFKNEGVLPPRDLGFLGTQFQKVESQNFIADCISDNWEFAAEKTLELIREYTAVRNGGCNIHYSLSPKYLEGESLCK